MEIATPSMGFCSPVHTVRSSAGFTFTTLSHSRRTRFSRHVESAQFDGVNVPSAIKWIISVESIALQKCIPSGHFFSHSVALRGGKKGKVVKEQQ